MQWTPPELPSELRLWALEQGLHHALLLLFHARYWAGYDQMALYPHDVGVRFYMLHKAGMTEPHLRRLLELRLLRPAREAAAPGFPLPVSPHINGTPVADSCPFVLTDLGVEFACAVCGVPAAERLPLICASVCKLIPSWDAENKELHFDHRLVKKFPRPAPNQWTILGAFEEDGWPRRIDNPLAKIGTTEAEDRLHEAVKALNRHQITPLLNFFRDGSGQGVGWKIAPPSPPDRP